MSDLLELAARVEAAEGPDGELDFLIWAALNGVTDITYPDQAQPSSSSGRVEGRDAGGNWRLYGFIDPGKVARNWTPYGGEDRYPRVTASLDAALTLASGAGVLITLSEIKGDGMPLCVIGNPETAEMFEAVANTMPLALCAAALKARSTLSRLDEVIDGEGSR